MKVSELIIAISDHSARLDLDEAGLIIDRLDDDGFVELLMDMKDLVYHRDTTVGLWAVDIDPKRLMALFLEDQIDMKTVPKGMISKWKKWLEFYIFQIK